MNSFDRYVDAATRENTRKSYQNAIRHFEVEWGGFLPATADAVARYLANHAEEFSTSTLRQRLAALAQWHIDQGFPDPTKAPIVRKVMKGIQAVHPVQQKQARPLHLEQLERLVGWLDSQAALAQSTDNHAERLRCARDKSLLLLGFWRGFRADELTRLTVDHVDVVPGEGMRCYFPQTKGDRSYQGATFRAPALSRLCPVDAYVSWINAAHLASGPVFRGVDRWGHVADAGLHVDSLVRVLRAVLSGAGIASAERYSGHSLRRGFASWANTNGWDVRALMEYVGWKSAQSAMRYIDGDDPFARQRIEHALPPQWPASAARKT